MSIDEFNVSQVEIRVHSHSGREGASSQKELVLASDEGASTARQGVQNCLGEASDWEESRLSHAGNHQGKITKFMILKKKTLVNFESSNVDMI